MKNFWLAYLHVDVVYRIPGHATNFETALADCDPNKYPVVLLAHNPRTAKQAVEMNQPVDLILYKEIRK